MQKKYSLIYLTTGGLSPAEMIEIAAETGYDCIDARTIPMGLPGEQPFDLAADKSLFLQTRQAVREYGIPIDSIENARIYDGMDVRAYEPCLMAAAELGVTHVLSNIWSGDSSYAEEKFAELCDLAGRYGQTVDLEFVTWAAVKDLKESVSLLKRVAKPNAGILVDTLHFHRSRVTLAELQEVPPEWLYCLHICDAPDPTPEEAEALADTAREARLYPGDGAIDIRSIAEAASWPVYGIEIPNREHWERLGLREHAREALRRTKAYLGGEPI